MAQRRHLWQCAAPPCMGSCPATPAELTRRTQPTDWQWSRWERTVPRPKRRAASTRRWLVSPRLADRPTPYAPSQDGSSTRRQSLEPRSGTRGRSEEHTSELQSPCNLVCRLLLEKK